MTPLILTPKTIKAATFAALFIALEIALTVSVDRPTTAAIRALGISAPELIKSFKAITDFGKSFWYLAPSALGVLLCLALTRLPRNAPPMNPVSKKLITETGIKLSVLFAVIAVSGLVTDGLKWIIGRARPVLDQQSQLYGFQPFSSESAWNSMPSGHATTSIALAITLCILWPRGRGIWLIGGGILAASRVMVCAHYLSDILAGGLVASLTANQLLHSEQNFGILPCIHRLFPSDGGDKCAR